MKIPHRFLLVLGALLVFSAGVSAAPIPGLFNTGIGTNGALLTSGSIDPHWRIIQSADPTFPGPNAIVLNDAGFPIPPWLANGPNSKWLAPRASQDPGNAAGDYKYRITFDLTGLEPFTAVITGTWTSDNAGPEVLLNGVSTGFASDGNFPALGNAFTINSGFIDGTNTLDFVVNNAGTAVNPTGIRVELSGTAESQPPPGTPPTIAVPPGSSTVGLLDVATFNVMAAGSRPFSFQWRREGIPLDNATNANFTIGNARLSDTGAYDVIVSNSAGAITSVVANLTVVFLSPAQLSYEPLGPSSRRSGLTFSEIMYHPRDRVDLRNGEFIEIFNSNPFQEDISGYRLTGELDYTFPNGTIIPGLGFLVVAPSPSDVQTIYGISGVLGGSTNRINNGGGTIRLQKKSGGVLLETIYSDQAPWPIAPDSSGHSLVLARPSYGENNPHAWAASATVGGSPGTADPIPTGALEDVVINEILAHTDLPLLDFVELHNHSTRSVDLSGCWLTDDADTNKFRIADGTTLPPGGFISFGENQLGFALRASGDEVLLVNSNQTRVIDAVRFGGQANGIAYGRFPDGAPRFEELAARTPGSSNAPPLSRDVVINEIMFNPLSGSDDDEYVELHNRGASPVNVGGWRFIEGITHTIPTGTIIPAGGYLVVAGNASRLLTNYPGLNPANTIGNFNGKLANGGERLVLGIPDTILSTNPSTMAITTNLFYIAADDVTYADGGRWGRWADGGGSSLELTDARSDNRAGASWADSDDTAKSSWTTVEFTGVLDLGSGTADKLDILLFGEGEALVDDIEVLVSSVNRVTNSTLESGINGWLLQGTHNKSSLETNGGFNSARSIHLRASDRGDQAANHLRTTLSSAVAPGATATLRAKVRWLRGSPEILLRLKGNYLEAFGRMGVPANLGTPGAANSTVRANIGPAIIDVSHRPILPQAGQPIRVVARVSDPDLVTGVSLKYRIDPLATLSTVPMLDDGTGPDALAGDGIYTGLIPAQSNGKLVAFRVEATDGFSSPATTQFPNEAPLRECLVRVGETQPAGSFASYRLWLTAATVNTWASREKLSNENLDGTFAYGSTRVVYNVGAHYSGSSYTSPGYTSPVGALCGYDITFPSDELFLGEPHTIMDWPVRDTTEQREQMMYWLLEQFGLPNMYRRYVIMYVNGLRRGELMDDIQQPSGTTVEEWFPGDSEGTLLKTDCWDEFNDVGDRETGCVALNALQHFTTTGGAKKLARYRWTWRPRATRGTANDFSELFALIDSANAPVANYQSSLESLADIEHWMRTFAANDLPSYWDSFGNPNAKNTYLYKPENDRWKLMCWDMDVGLGASTVNAAAEAPNAPLFPTLGDPNMNRIYAHPAFLRLYWNALDEAVNSFFQSGPGTKIDEILAAKYAAFQASGLNLISPFVPSGGNNISIPEWINQRRAFLLTQLNTVSSTFSVTGTNSFSTNRNFITISGTAPVRARTISVNGISYPITWTTVTSWRLLVPLADGTNVLNIAALDRNGGTLSNQTLTVNSTATSPSPQDVVVINEIMFHPLEPDAEYLEIFNTSTNSAFDLSNWRINGLDYTFPPGTVITNRQFIVLVKDPAAFIRAYSNAIPVLDVFSGNLQSGGETLTLIRPAAHSNEVDLVVDKVRYENRPPWSTNANGTGSSLQVIDPNQENSRVGNWSSSFVPAVVTPAVSTPAALRDGWRFFSASGSIGAGESGIMRLLIYLDVVGSALIDDVSIVAGTNAAAGFNYVANGDFESPLTQGLTNSWRLGTQAYSESIIVSDLVHAGTGAFKIIGTNIGQANAIAGFNRSIFQFLSPAPAANSINTLSFWYWATNSASNLLIRVRNSPALTTGIQGTNINIFLTPSNFVAAVTNRPATNSFSPGIANRMTTNLAPFQPLWINEVQAENLSGIDDNMGEREPWIEIYNGSTNTVSLDGLYLSSSYTNLTEWAFPTGHSIAPGQFRVIFADGEPGETGLATLHTSFRLPAASGSVALSRIHSNAPQVMDYVNYSGLHDDRSYGSFPDGQPFDRQEFFYVTPGATNNGTSGPLVVFINEWMAGNASALADPADGNFEDWFELYNPATNAVDLAGYYLTDSLTNAAGVVTNKFKFLITTNMAHTIPPQGYLLVWADNETGQNLSLGVPRADMHVDFALSVGGEAIGLFAADGTQIDRVTFRQQTNDVSQGRFPDGGAGIYYMPASVSPRAANYVPGFSNAAPMLDALGNKIIFLGQTLAFTATANDSDLPMQALTFSLDPAPPASASITGAGVFDWTPATAGTNTITIRVTDNGVPPMSDSETITVEVLSAIRFASSLRHGDNTELTWSTRAGKSYVVEFKDDLNVSQWTPLGTNLATGDLLKFTNTTINVPQRFFRLRTVD